MEVLTVLTKFIILFSLFTSSLASNLISETCAKTRNPDLCRRILTANRKALKAASPLDLGKISVDLSKSSAQETKKTIRRMMRTRDKVLLKDRYKNCETNYASAVYYLNTASYYLKRLAFKEVAKHAAAAVNEPIYCRVSFEKGGPAQPGWLKEGNEKLECLCRVVLEISNRLSGRNDSRN